MRAKSFRQCLTNANDARYPRPMSDRPLSKSAPPASPKQSSASEEASSRKPGPIPRVSEASRWATYAALALAVVATGPAALACFFPAHVQASVPQQDGDPIANLCAAYNGPDSSVVVKAYMQSRDPNN